MIRCYGWVHKAVAQTGDSLWFVRSQAQRREALKDEGKEFG
jgi:hypothetical protein